MRALALRCIGMAVTAFGGPAVSAERRFRHPLYVGYLLGA